MRDRREFFGSRKSFWKFQQLNKLSATPSRFNSYNNKNSRGGGGKLFLRERGLKNAKKDKKIVREIMIILIF